MPRREQAPKKSTRFEANFRGSQTVESQLRLRDAIGTKNTFFPLAYIAKEMSVAQQISLFFFFFFGVNKLPSTNT